MVPLGTPMRDSTENPSMAQYLLLAFYPGPFQLLRILTRTCSQCSTKNPFLFQGFHLEPPQWGPIWNQKCVFIYYQFLWVPCSYYLNLIENLTKLFYGTYGISFTNVAFLCTYVKCKFWSKWTVQNLTTTDLIHIHGNPRMTNPLP